MKQNLAISAVLATLSLTLAACDRPSSTVVAVPGPTVAVPGPTVAVPVPGPTVVVPGPAGAPGASGAPGSDGAKGEPGRPGDSTTVIVTPKP